MKDVAKRNKALLDESGRDRLLQLRRTAQLLRDAALDNATTRHVGGIAKACGGKLQNIDEWLAYAEIVIGLNANPTSYVGVQFGGGNPQFVSQLFGPDAIARWKNTYRPVVDPEMDSNGLPVDTLPENMILGRVADMKRLLLQNHYSEDLSEPRTRAYVLTRLPGYLDPLAMVILSPEDDIWEVYGSKAAEEVLANPGLIAAMKKVDLGLAARYIETHLCNG